MKLTIEKKKLVFGIALLFALLFSGCPYKSAVPLKTSKEYKIDHKLLGEWIILSKDAVVKVSSISKNGYLMEAVVKGTKKKELLRAYGTTIKGVSFLSLTDPSKNKKGYSICKYSIERDLLRIECLEENAASKRIVNSEELHSIVERKMNNDSAFKEAFSFGDIKRVEKKK